MNDQIQEKSRCNGVESTINQVATAVVSQEESVSQQNTSQQEYAIAVALNGACALAVQFSNQINECNQEGTAEAENEVENNSNSNGVSDFSLECLPLCTCCPNISQTATATVEQAQEVTQSNTNSQTGAIAVAEGEDAEAIAAQVSNQKNSVDQKAEAEAENSIGDDDEENDNQENGNTNTSNISVTAEQKDAGEPIIQTKINKEIKDMNEKTEAVQKVLKEQVADVLDRALKIVLKVDKNSGTIEINADENGQVIVNENMTKQPEARNVDVKALQRNKGNVAVTISQDGQNLEIKADENGVVTVNGQALELDK